MNTTHYPHLTMVNMTDKQYYIIIYICDRPSKNQPSLHLVWYFKRYHFKMFGYKNLTSALYCAYIPYRAKLWRGKTLANWQVQDFGEENIGKYTDWPW